MFKAFLKDTNQTEEEYKANIKGKFNNDDNNIIPICVPLINYDNNPFIPEEDKTYKILSEKEKMKDNEINDVEKIQQIIIFAKEKRQKEKEEYIKLRQEKLQKQLEEDKKMEIEKKNKIEEEDKNKI